MDSPEVGGAGNCGFYSSGLLRDKVQALPTIYKVEPKNTATTERIFGSPSSASSPVQATALELTQTISVAPGGAPGQQRGKAAVDACPCPGLLSE